MAHGLHTCSSHVNVLKDAVLMLFARDAIRSRLSVRQSNELYWTHVDAVRETRPLKAQLSLAELFSLYNSNTNAPTNTMRQQ